MLVLARSKDGIIRIGNDIEIKVLSIQAHVVRLGITAPTSVEIDRQEVYEKKRAGQKHLGSGSRVIEDERTRTQSQQGVIP